MKFTKKNETNKSEKSPNNIFFILKLPLIILRYNKYITNWKESIMKLEIYYNNLSIRLFVLITLNIILSSFYLKYLNHSNRSSLLKQEKDIYLLQITYWILFTGGFFVKSLPPSNGNVIGYFASEFIILAIIFISYTFLLWKLFNKKRFDFGIFFFTLPLIMLFCFVLGIV